ncbi:MAG TPA: alpha-isopropylmalate synthase regulatory domain-containing protein [Microbacterium sp.]|nr:alpha-isopropylmalate synthase regulatory domain-containing protein [Microbacterium sp.]
MTNTSQGESRLDATLREGDDEVVVQATANGPVAAFLDIMRERGHDVTLYDYTEHTLSASGDAEAAAYVELQVDDQRLWGVGVDGDIATASLKAIVSAVNRSIRVREKSLVEA